MHAFTCDGCKQELDAPVYTLSVLYAPGTGSVQSEQHFHWTCLKKYVANA